MATINELVSRTYEHLENNFAFWPREEVITNGLNPAQRLLTIHDQGLVIKRTTVSLLIDQCFYDLRSSGTTNVFRLHRVVVGDDTTDPVVESQGRFYRLRPSSLKSLRARSDWLLKRQPYPTHYWRYGLYWLGIYPRPTLTHTVTLIYSSIPTAMSTLPLDGNTTVDVPESWTPLLPEIAAALLMCKEGAGEISEAIQWLGRITGPENMIAMKASLEKLQKRLRYKGREG